MILEDLDKGEPMKPTMTSMLHYRALTSHATEAIAIQKAEKWGNVAFVRGGVILTCSRSYVCSCLNAGQDLTVLADFDDDNR